MQNEEEYQEIIEPIAIIGMSGRFPGADNTEAFWQNICNGVESLDFYTEEEVIASGVDPELAQHPNYVKARMRPIEHEQFDAFLFGFSPTEAAVMDPQQRLFIECAWEALERAGYGAPAFRPNRTGVFAGAGPNRYLLHNLAPNMDMAEFADGFQILITNEKDHLATRTSYLLDLRGPSLSVNTACSTSLVTVHMACQSLLNYQCDLALAGGVSIEVQPEIGYLYEEGMIASPDGHCRTFDAKGQGTIGGSGVGVVALKRLEDALADGDSIHAVIRGSAINNDGALKVGYTAPSVEGQANAIVEAIAMAEVDAQSIGYVEAHGTATTLGDPIEIEALTQAFRKLGSEENEHCAIGSVKTNVGHLDSAAGVAGIIKATKALEHKKLPPSLHYTAPNPAIDFANSPFRVNAELTDWEANGTPRRAGVSSFGIGGTNAHAVLEEAPEMGDSGPSRDWQLLLLSAKTDDALEAATFDLATHLQEQPHLNLADVAFTLQVGRKGHEARRMVVCGPDSDAAGSLLGGEPQRLFGAGDVEDEQDVVFMFPGQGSQYVNMGLDLYQSEAVFRNQVDQCAEALEPHLGLDIRTLLYPGQEKGDDQDDLHEISQQLNQTQNAQPALFTIEYALAQLWLSWGVTPRAMLGHSIGEYVAACLAGVLSLSDALKLVAKRGALMQAQQPGSMLTVPLSEEKVLPLLDDELSLAAINGPSLCVISGPTKRIERLETELKSQGLDVRLLHTSHAFHSSMMEPALAPFAQALSEVELSPPQIPVASNLSGQWLTDDQATSADYWCNHLRGTVRFSDNLALCKQHGYQTLLEVGPGQSLSMLTRRQLTPGQSTTPDRQNAIPSLRRPQDERSDEETAITALGKLWLAGVAIDWTKFYSEEERHRVCLPTYPFQRQRFWIDPPSADELNRLSVETSRGMLSKKSDISEWFYVPSWQRSLLLSETALETMSEAERDSETAQHWLLFVDQHGIGQALAERLRQAGHQVTTAEAGSVFSRQSDHAYTIDPQQPAVYVSLLNDLKNQGQMPTKLVHFWNVDDTQSRDVTRERIERSQSLGFYSLLYLAQALSQLNSADECELIVFSSNLHEITGEEALHPEKMTLLGPIKVIAQEFPGIHCRAVDLAVPQLGTPAHQRLQATIWKEVMAKSSDSIVAYRGTHRWVQTFDALSIPAQSHSNQSPANENGVAATTEVTTNGQASELETLITESSQPVQNGYLNGNGAHEQSIATVPVGLRNKGVYLITGGFGNIGLLWATYLAKTVQARLVLVGRSGLPERDAWSGWLDSHDEDDGTSRKIRAVQAIEAAGGEVLPMSANVVDGSQMSNLIAQTREQFGALHGVIHAAGIADESAFDVIQEMTKPDCERQFQAKVYGVVSLEEALNTLPNDEQPDFCLLISSLASVLGGLGYITYSAVNLFMDAFAHYHNSRVVEGQAGNTNTRWLSINWDAWDFGDEEDDAAWGTTLGSLAIAPEEGIEALLRLVPYQDSSQVVISTGDLQKRIAQWIQLDTAGGDGKGPDSSGKRHPRPNWLAAYVAPRSEIEEKLCDIYQEVLSIEQIGIYDDFFDLGGHSLLAIQLTSRLREQFQMDLSINTLFTESTVAGLAEYIDTLQKVTEEWEMPESDEEIEEGVL
ncbi:MAG: SDR family oxidoreductase [Chloroflexota bacterium]